MRAMPCCRKRRSLRMPSVQAFSGISVERRRVRSSLPCSAHSPFIWPSFLAQLFLPRCYWPRQSLIMVISWRDLIIWSESTFLTLRFPVLERSTNRDLACRYMNYSLLRVPTTFADCTLRFTGLLIPDFRKSYSYYSIPFTGRTSEFAFTGILGQAAKYFCTSSCFCSSLLEERWQDTLAKTAWILSVAGAKFYSMREINSPSWSSRSMSSPSSDSLAQICLYGRSSISVFLAEAGREGARAWWGARRGLWTMALMTFCMFFFLRSATLLGGDSGQLQLWMSLMFSKLYISGITTSFWKCGTRISADLASSLSINKFIIPQHNQNIICLLHTINITLFSVFRVFLNNVYC